MPEKIKTLFSKYKHILLLAYYLLYLPWFGYLNSHVPARTDVHYMHTPLDDYIPFWEIFVIPYFVWFVYIAAGYIFLFFASRSEFIRMCIFLYVGMTFCLIVYTLYPNGQNLRVDYSQLGRDNFLIFAIRKLQEMDTKCNVFPSIHVLNSLGMHFAISRSKHLGRHRNAIVAASLVTITLVILSTVFVKQHSVLDVIAAFAVAVPLYFISYRVKYKRLGDD